MKKKIFFLFFFFLNSCSLNKDSKYWNEDMIKFKENQKKLLEILNKSDDITEMTLKEYTIYIDDLTKKSKYPNISR